MPHVYLSNEEIDAILRVSPGLDLSKSVADDLVRRLFKALAEPSERELAIVSIAREQHHVDGEVEIDDPADGIATISEGDGNGAYVLAWVWADFSGTELNKEGDDRCSECGASLEDGEGYDGKCGNCADREENEDE
ncbi:hypothetical protein [Magnetospirillum molischianum]|uniref:Uncharacterized protein n=1 Tax=Magnetospirillum molischianum DSM 120 TaxID=1150626 RepID=H8FYA1_MAGML|nr:hypothetical protein [Magnetospirillum molischianum]CCG43339.1 hypothetical protein PHAMO_80130 [Magnetospirillum molischianum DSM 120]